MLHQLWTQRPNLSHVSRHLLEQLLKEAEAVLPHFHELDPRQTSADLPSAFASLTGLAGELERLLNLLRLPWISSRRAASIVGSIFPLLLRTSWVMLAGPAQGLAIAVDALLEPVPCLLDVGIGPQGIGSRLCISVSEGAINDLSEKGLDVCSARLRDLLEFAAGSAGLDELIVGGCRFHEISHAVLHALDPSFVVLVPAVEETVLDDLRRETCCRADVRRRSAAFVTSATPRLTLRMPPPTPLPRPPRSAPMPPPMLGAPRCCWRRSCSSLPV